MYITIKLNNTRQAEQGEHYELVGNGGQNEKQLTIKELVQSNHESIEARFFKDDTKKLPYLTIKAKKLKNGGVTFI